MGIVGCEMRCQQLPIYTIIGSYKYENNEYIVLLGHIKNSYFLLFFITQDQQLLALTKIGIYGLLKLNL